NSRDQFHWPIPLQLLLPIQRKPWFGFIRLLCIFILFAPCAIVHAQPYPAKPIRMIVGFAPGGGTDVTARAIAQLLSDRLGQGGIVDNRPGGGGAMGMRSVWRT